MNHPTGFRTRALQSSPKDGSLGVSRSKLGSAGSIGSGIAMALVPKCPACAAAYLGVVSAFGIDQWAPDFLWPLTYGLFGLAIAFLGLRALRTASFRPFVLSVLGAVVLACGRVYDAHPALVWAGALMFVLGVLWSARAYPRSDHAPATCHSTEAVEGVPT